MMSKKMTYAQALNEAKQLIVEQGDRIKTDGRTIKSLNQEISQRKAVAAELQREVEKLKLLEVELAKETSAKEQAQGVIGKLRVQIDGLETTIAERDGSIAERDALLAERDGTIAERDETINGQELVIRNHENRITELLAEVDRLRGQLPTDADISALNDIAELLGGREVDAPAAAPVRIAEEPAEKPAKVAEKPVRQVESGRRSPFNFTRQAA